MGNADEGHRTDGLDDRAPLRDRLRKAWPQQAALQIDHRAFRAAKTKRAAIELVLGRVLIKREMSAFGVPAQPVDATQALNLSAGVSNCKVSRGRSFS